MEHQRSTMTDKFPLLNLAYHPYMIVIDIGLDLRELASREWCAGDVDVHTPTWVVDGVDAQTIAVFPLAIALC